MVEQNTAIIIYTFVALMKRSGIKVLTYPVLDYTLLHQGYILFIHKFQKTAKIVSEFNNVTIIKKTNIYFDGKVTSRAVKFSDGTIKTLGFMMPGEYTFGTDKKEIMWVI